MAGYARAPLPYMYEAQDTISFMLLNCDDYEILGSDLPKSLSFSDNDAFQVVRIYGVTENGHSVLVHIHNIVPRSNFDINAPELPFAEQYLSDINLKGMQWVTVSDFKVRKSEHMHSKCQLEIDILEPAKACPVDL